MGAKLNNPPYTPSILYNFFFWNKPASPFLPEKVPISLLYFPFSMPNSSSKI